MPDLAEQPSPTRPGEGPDVCQRSVRRDSIGPPRGLSRRAMATLHLSSSGPVTKGHRRQRASRSHVSPGRLYLSLSPAARWRWKPPPIGPPGGTIPMRSPWPTSWKIVSDSLSFYELPITWWKRVRTNNPLERLIRTLRDRLRPMGTFANDPAIQRAVFGQLLRRHKIKLTH